MGAHEKVPYWEGLFGGEVIVKKLGAAEEIFALMRACELEAYSECRSAAVLAPLAEAPYPHCAANFALRAPRVFPTRN